MANEIVKCKNCGNDIPQRAKFCTHCGAKCKSNKGLIVGLVVLVLISIGATGCAGVGDRVVFNEENEQENTENAIDYIQVSVDDLNEALDKNPLNASDTYNGQYVEITGRLGVIDASGDYIGVYSLNNRWDFTGVHCSIEKDEQLEIIKTMSIDDTVTVRGKITSVGEILGYNLDIIQIAQYDQGFSDNSNDYEGGFISDSVFAGNSIDNTEREITDFIGLPLSNVIDIYGSDFIITQNDDMDTSLLLYKEGCPYIFYYSERDFSGDNIIRGVGVWIENTYIGSGLRIGMSLSEVEEILGTTLNLEQDGNNLACVINLNGFRTVLDFDSQSMILFAAVCHHFI